MSVSNEFKRVPPGPLGEVPALLTRAFNFPVDEHAADDAYAAGQYRRGRTGRAGCASSPRSTGTALAGVARHRDDAPPLCVKSQRRRVPDSAGGTRDDNRRLLRHGSRVHSGLRGGHDGAHASPFSFTIAQRIVERLAEAAHHLVDFGLR